MLLQLLRICLLLGVGLGLVLPKASAALADLGLGTRVVVICTVHGLQEITLPDPDRAPGEGRDGGAVGEAQPCLMGHAVTPSVIVPAPVWHRLIPAPRPRPALAQALPAPPRPDAYPRAPPRA